MSKFLRTLTLAFFITVFIISCLWGFYISYKNLKTASNGNMEVVLTGNTKDQRIALTTGGENYEIDFYLMKNAEKLRNEYFYLLPPWIRFWEKILYMLATSQTN